MSGNNETNSAGESGQAFVRMTHSTLPEGQRLLMTNSTIDHPVKMKDKVPLLGDLPLMGRLFRSKSEGMIQKPQFGAGAKSA